MKIRFHRRRSEAGFTLIELLTVIAIIGILAAIVIATVGKVRQNAQRTRSLANLRQIGGAVQIYVTENKNQVPYWNDYTSTMENGPGNPPLNYRYWWEYLETYVGKNWELFHSPADMAFDSSNRERMRETISYGWNYEVLGRHRGDPSKTGDHMLRITDFFNPARTLVASDGRREYSWGFIALDSPPDINRYNGKVPSLFLDGHVTVVPGAEFSTRDPWFNAVKVLPPDKQ